MRVIRSIEELSAESFRSPVVTIGVFDGVHRGHQHLFAELTDWAQQVQGERVVITFREHPLTVLGRIPPAALTSVDHRLLFLERAGIDVAVVLPFDRELASWSPERFAQRVLKEGMGCRHFLLGFNSGFGKDAAGTEEYFRAHPDLDLEVRTARPFLLEGEPISSTEVRRAVLKGELERASQLLGRPPSIYGEVIHGDGRGRTLGFPTANLNLFHSAAPPHGVYVAEAFVDPAASLGEGAEGQGSGRRGLGALVNIGRRPTFLHKDDPLNYSRYYNEQLDKIEVFIRGFEDSIYGQRLEVVLHQKVRDERRFENSEALVNQIHADVEALERWLAERQG